MIEFYHKNNKKNYRTKIKQLIKDLSTLLSIENIPLSANCELNLEEKFSENLNKQTWNHVNQLYNTIFENNHRVSGTLLKFINKTKNKNDQFTLIDTFAGCGGFSLGLEHAGFNTILANDINNNFLETYYFNRELTLDKIYCEDITQFLKIDKKKVDLLVGGPPCQGFSMANRQRIIDDPRNYLYRAFLEVIKKFKPKFFIMENVKGMMSRSDEIQHDFNNNLDNEYSVQMFMVNAKEFDVPQNRERVFVIGSRSNEIHANKIVYEILDNRNRNNNFLLKDAIEDLPILYSKDQKNSPGLENEKIGFKFRKHILKSTKYTDFINFNNTDYLFNHTNRYNNLRDISIFEKLPEGGNSLHPNISQLMPYSRRNNIFKDKYYKLPKNKISKTITSHMKYDCNMYIHPDQSRGLSPREAARIQSFPDDYIFMSSNNSWYEQIGNAVPVKMAELMGKSIIKYLK